MVLQLVGDPPSPLTCLPFWMLTASSSEEIKIEAILNPSVRFGEISIMYSSRLGETKLNAWRDGFQNIVFLLRKRFLR